MKSLVNFGIYSISNPEFLLSLDENFKNKSNLNPELLTETRPFACMYLKSKYGKRPYFVPLTSINPNSKTFRRRDEKWNEFAEWEKNKEIKTFHIMKSPTNNTPGFKSVALIYQAFPVPYYGIRIKPFIRHKEIITVPEETAVLLKDLTQKYLDATQTSRKRPFVPLKGHLKSVYYSQDNKEYSHYPVNHCLLLDIMKAKEIRIEKAKEAAKQKKEEEKEK